MQITVVINSVANKAVKVARKARKTFEKKLAQTNESNPKSFYRNV